MTQSYHLQMIKGIVLIHLNGCESVPIIQYSYLSNVDFLLNLQSKMFARGLRKAFQEIVKIELYVLKIKKLVSLTYCL